MQFVVLLISSFGYTEIISGFWSSIIRTNFQVKYSLIVHHSCKSTRCPLKLYLHNPLLPSEIFILLHFIFKRLRLEVRTLGQQVLPNPYSVTYLVTLDKSQPSQISTPSPAEKKKGKTTKQMNTVCGLGLQTGFIQSINNR